MKLAIHNSYGQYVLPREFHRTSNDRAENAELLANWLLNRKDIPEYQFSETLTDSDMKKIRKMIVTGVGCVHVVGYSEGILYDRYYMENVFSSEIDINLSAVKIVEIDTSKIWMLNECNGKEIVHYFKCDRNNKLVEIQ